jgi:hypothetical protein
MQSEYSPSWTDYTSNLNSLGQGVQLWTVPETATYTIDAYGASGGSTSSHLGGRGAQVRGDFELTQGEIIRIVVGQAGAYGPHTQNYNNANDACASGGGGTYVVRTPYNTNASILVIAGGGGGATQNYWGNYAGIDAASHSTSGNSGAGNNGGGTNGNGGSGNVSGGGAGFSVAGLSGNPVARAFTDGTSVTSAHTSGLNHSVGGAGHPSWGAYPTYLAWGGFGGGGGGGGLASGGGGGYSGGGGGTWTGSAGNNQSGGGGGSYNNGTNPYNTMKGSHSIPPQSIPSTHAANGKVIITKL